MWGKKRKEKKKIKNKERGEQKPNAVLGEFSDSSPHLAQFLHLTGRMNQSAMQLKVGKCSTTYTGWKTRSTAQHSVACINWTPSVRTAWIHYQLVYLHAKKKKVHTHKRTRTPGLEIPTGPKLTIHWSTGAAIFMEKMSSIFSAHTLPEYFNKRREWVSKVTN